MAPNANYFGNSRTDVNKWLSFIENNKSPDLHSTIPEYEIIRFNYFCFERYFLSYSLQYYSTTICILWLPNDCLFVWFLFEIVNFRSHWFVVTWLQFPCNIHAVMGNIGERVKKRERNRKYNCLLKIANEIYMLNVYHWHSNRNYNDRKLCARRSRGKKKEE